MSFKLAAIESFSFDGEEFSAAGAAALRKVRTLAESAPVGRLFASITTLSDMSASVADALDKGALQKATHVARNLADKSDAKLPGFFRRKKA